MATLILSLLIPLTACNHRQSNVPVHSVSSIYIPQNEFTCMDKPSKPEKVVNPSTGQLAYKSSDASKFINNLDASDTDCRTQLHTVRDIYNKQIEAQKSKQGVDKEPAQK